MSILVYFGLGSNIEPRKKNLEFGIHQILNVWSSQFTCSSIYESKPYCGLDQSSYYNCCVQVETSQTPKEIFNIISNIEYQIGRNRTTNKKWESRTLDIDILLYGNELIKTETLNIPHYDLCNRDFFLLPLLELNPHLVHPETKQTLQNIYDQIPIHSKTLIQKLPRNSLTFKSLI